MATSIIQLKVENWIWREWLPEVYGQAFRPASLQLSSGGNFNFDAVSADNRIVANISTSGAKTARGKNAAGKIQKIRADMLFLLMVPADKRLIVLTERDMFDLWEAERRSGRVPLEFEFVPVELPDELIKELNKARRIASDEVSPPNFGKVHGLPEN